MFNSTYYTHGAVAAVLNCMYVDVECFLPVFSEDCYGIHMNSGEPFSLQYLIGNICSRLPYD